MAAEFENPDLTPSIVDTILNLDELLSANVRRAERSARFALKPWLEADIDDLNAELDSLTDALGNPLEDMVDRTVGGGGRSATTVALELLEKQRELAASFRTVRMQQMPQNQWVAFDEKWSEVLKKGAPYPQEFWKELVVKTASQPEITAEQYDQLRGKLGHPQVDLLCHAAWEVNTQSGVSVPKSPLSSRVLRQREPDES